MIWLLVVGVWVFLIAGPYVIATVRVRLNRGAWPWQIEAWRPPGSEMREALRALRAGWNDKEEAMRILRGEGKWRR